ncbi:MAG: vWA domain-containing protein [Gemmataceae bacterium]
MEFARPWLLMLLIALPLLAWWWFRARPAALRYSDTGLLAELPAGRERWARWSGLALRIGGLGLLIVALAGPRWPDRTTPIITEGVSIMVLLDVSGSMAERDYFWQGEQVTRLEAAKNVLRLFVTGGQQDGVEFIGRSTDAVGLIAFATRPENTCPLTLSHSALLRALAAEQPRAGSLEAETNLSDAIVLGLHRLRQAKTQRKVLILLSDGEQTVREPVSGWMPRQAAQLAANMGIPVHTIDTGGVADSEAAALERELGRQILQTIATMTQGQYFEANDSAALLRVGQQLDQLERAPIRSFLYWRYYEAYPWVALAALVFLLGAFCLEQTVWQRLP